MVLAVPSETRRILRFLFVGLVNTGFSYLCFLALLWLGQSLAAAVVLATVAGVLFNFFSYGAFVFGPAKGWSFILFVLLYAVIMGLNYSALRGLSALGLPAEIGQIFCIPLIATLSYLGMRFWVYAPPRPPDDGEHSGKGGEYP